MLFGSPGCHNGLSVVSPMSALRKSGWATNVYDGPGGPALADGEPPKARAAGRASAAASADERNRTSRPRRLGTGFPLEEGRHATPAHGERQSFPLGLSVVISENRSDEGGQL